MTLGAQHFRTYGFLLARTAACLRWRRRPPSLHFNSSAGTTSLRWTPTTLRTMQSFNDPRLKRLNDDIPWNDSGMRNALVGALEESEIAYASYHVSAHIWLQAALTDRALLLVKGAVHAKVIRLPLPLEVTRPPSSSRLSLQTKTPFGKKTLWGSKLDPEVKKLLTATKRHPPHLRDRSTRQEKHDAKRSETAPETRQAPQRSPTEVDTASGIRAPEQSLSRRLGRGTNGQRLGPRPRKPRRKKVRKQRVGFAPPTTIWDLADRCVKCGRPLTDPRSRQARVGTKCIRVWGSQARKIPNPAHSLWVTRKSRAEADFVARKAQADAEFERAQAAFSMAKAEWAHARSAYRQSRRVRKPRKRR